MLIRTPGPHEPRSSEITPRAVYLNRRALMSGAAAVAATVAGCEAPTEAALKPAVKGQPLTASRNQALSVTDPPTPWDSATTYNNFYEFGTDKADPALNAHTLRPRPWTVDVGGLCQKPKAFDIEEILKLAPLEERVYVLRCVEGWSMVIPWIGFPLSEVLTRVEPTPKAKFVEFATLFAPTQMPGLARPVLDWPYREGLRLDEAMNPLTILAVGLYGAVLPNQNGAPIRLVVPWKYGFKSIKSIVRIKLVGHQPQTAWETSQPNEYGFYSNVNPEVDHPRWSQARERRIGEFFKRPTLMFNGYGDQVASMYAGMDLRKYY
jgi:methionine sulfoxide reductase catalytic subunit